MTPFQAAYGHTPLVSTNFVLQQKVALADQLVQEVQDILIQVRDKLVHVQQKYQKQANKHRRHTEFNEGDLVLLYVASHRYKTVKSDFPKLRPRCYGPFKIIKKNSVVSYKLELPPSWGKLHRTFHISWLKQYIQGDSPVPELSSYVPEMKVSSIGVGDSLKAINEQTLQVLKLVLEAKYVAEEELKSSGLTYTILRPGGLQTGPASGKGILTEDASVLGLITRADVASLIMQILFKKEAEFKTMSAIDAEKLQPPTTSLEGVEIFPIS
ncbi:hypothetical protein L7F22_038516 [Adiantum nelumboides]|nr:hypothetical protein [Adiantum nelumboides]